MLSLFFEKTLHFTFCHHITLHIYANNIPKQCKNSRKYTIFPSFFKFYFDEF